jgi:hypothetical protein
MRHIAWCCASSLRLLPDLAQQDLRRLEAQRFHTISRVVDPWEGQPPVIGIGSHASMEAERWREVNTPFFRVIGGRFASESVDDLRRNTHYDARAADLLFQVVSRRYQFTKL